MQTVSLFFQTKYIMNTYIHPNIVMVVRVAPWTKSPRISSSVISANSAWEIPRCSQDLCMRSWELERCSLALLPAGHDRNISLEGTFVASIYPSVNSPLCSPLLKRDQPICQHCPTLPCNVEKVCQPWQWLNIWCYLTVELFDHPGWCRIQDDDDLQSSSSSVFASLGWVTAAQLPKH